MDEMNVHEIDYKGNHLTIRVTDKKEVCNFLLTILSVSINKDGHIINLGNFYTEFPRIVSDNYLKKFVKNLIDNIDTIIFKNNRYIGSEKKIIENLNSNYVESTLGEIYTEFLDMSRDSIGYIKYSRFLELYFYGHTIPDSIKKIYLERESKSILDFDNLDDIIRSEFSGNIKELKDEDEYEYNVKCLEQLNGDLKFKEEEIKLLNTMIDKVNNILNRLDENDEINTSIDELESKLKEISFFDKSRREIKGTLNSLVNSLNIIDEEKERNELYELYSNYASIYKDTRGLLILFDNLSLEDILILLEDIYRIKKVSYDDTVVRIENLNNKIANYNNETIDISDLYERLESK